MRLVLALAFISVLPTQVYGQIRGPQDIQVAVGRLASVKLVVDGEDSKYVVLGDDNFGAFREFSLPSEWNIKVLGYQSGVGYIVVSATKGGKLLDPFVIKITVGSGPSPPLPPIPPPLPEPPADPLVVALRDAAKKDSWLGLPSLARGLQLCYDLTENAMTIDRYVAAVKAALKAANPDGVPDTVYNIISAETAKLDSLVPPKSPAGTPLSYEGKLAAKSMFLRLHQACEKASK